MSTNTEGHTEHARTNSGSSSSNPGSVICCFQPAALLSERLMDFKRVKNDDHPHKWACQIQDRVLEQHFKQGDYLFQSAGGNMNICCCVNHTAVLSCIVEKGKLENAFTSLHTQTLLEVSCLNVGNGADVASMSLLVLSWK